MHSENFLFKLKKYKTPSDRETCPICGGKREYARYVSVRTGDLLPEKYGWCNRRDSCGYHLNPMKDGYVDGTESNWTAEEKTAFVPNIKPNVIVDLPAQLLIDTLPWITENTLLKYFLKLFPESKVRELFKAYLLGNHTVWPGAVIFWFVNGDGAVRAGQVKQFDETGHTVKAPDKEGKIRSRTLWIHKLIKEDYDWMPGYLAQDLRQDCLFGEHLLKKYSEKPCALFESPKTAMMAAAYFPDYLCLAFGSLDNFTYDRAKVLKGRKVILYPDLSKTGSAFQKWVEKADRFKTVTTFQISRILEDNATDEERINGLDMGDFLERFNYLEFVSKQIQSDTDVITEPVMFELFPQPVMQTEVVDVVESQPELMESVIEKLVPLSSKQQFDAILMDLDNGATWSLIKGRDPFVGFKTDEAIQNHFRDLCRRFVTNFSENEKRAFVQDRRKAGYTNFGIIDGFPALGFRKEWDLKF